MTTATSRRAILAGAASLAAVPAIAAPAPDREWREPSLTELGKADPIFAAIEAHKAAFRAHLAALAIHFADEEDEAADAATGETSATRDDAAMELVNVVPTTVAGVLALIEYVDTFNHGYFKLDDMNSCPAEWPAACSFDFGIGDDDDDECGMAYAVLLNVRAALAGMAVKS